MMKDLSERISSLSPQRRQLLERLLKGQGRQAPAEPSAQTCEQSLREGLGQPQETAQEPAAAGNEGCGGTVRFDYDAYHEQCNASVFGKHSFFMNLGYRANNNPQSSKIELPPHVINRNSVKLVLELIGDCRISGCDILDVGCGRGGTIHVLKTYFDMRMAVGIDLSLGAISFCNAVHRLPNVRFINGSAEKLPLEDRFFDVVTNVESSHAYADIFAFHAEVYRVLKAGGRFLYTDLFPLDRIDQYMDFLRNLGFMIERDQDITANVLASCDDTAGQQFEAFQGAERNSNTLLSDALGVPGSESYQRMKSGLSSFRILRLKKP